jgi:hypothetical protein
VRDPAYPGQARLPSTCPYRRYVTSEGNTRLRLSCTVSCILSVLQILPEWRSGAVRCTLQQSRAYDQMRMPVDLAIATGTHWELSTTLHPWRTPLLDATCLKAEEPLCTKSTRMLCSAATSHPNFVFHRDDCWRFASHVLGPGLHVGDRSHSLSVETTRPRSQRSLTVQLTLMQCPRATTQMLFSHLWLFRLGLVVLWRGRRQ